jgi:hypothetical protein
MWRYSRPKGGDGTMMSLDNVWLRAWRAFLPFHGVVGVGWGPKLKRGKVMAQNAVIVFVERKLPAGKVREGQHVPPEFEGYPTDVRVPRLVPDPKGPRDRCLTADVQWIDWHKIDQMWREQHAQRGPR